MVREKILVVRGEIWTLVAIVSTQCSVKKPSKFWFHLQQPICVKRHSHLLRQLKTSTVVGLKYKRLSVLQWRHWSQESINLFQTSSNKYHTNNFVIIKQVHFILIKWNFYDHYSIDVCTFLKKFMLVVRGIQNCEFSGPWGPNGWRPLQYIMTVRRNSSRLRRKIIPLVRVPEIVLICCHKRCYFWKSL
jgi:hypothetical protein